MAIGAAWGKWLTAIKGPTLISGQTYKLLLRYEGTSFQAYLNDRLLYENQEVLYSDGTTINGDWSGYSGIRLFGNESKLTIYSMRSGAVNSLQVEEPTEEFQTMKANWKDQLVSTTTDLANPAIANYVNALSDEAEKLYETMNQDPDRTYLCTIRIWEYRFGRFNHAIYKVAKTSVSIWNEWDKFLSR